LKLRFDSRKQELLPRRYVAEQELRIIDAWVGRSEELEKTKLSSAEARELSARALTPARRYKAMKERRRVCPKICRNH
jgi:hypothetical protein